MSVDIFVFADYVTYVYCNVEYYMGGFMGNCCTNTNIGMAAG